MNKTRWLQIYFELVRARPLIQRLYFHLDLWGKRRVQENGTCAGIVLNVCSHGVSSLTRQFPLWKWYEKKILVNLTIKCQLKEQHKCVNCWRYFVEPRRAVFIWRTVVLLWPWNMQIPASLTILMTLCRTLTTRGW